MGMEKTCAFTERVTDAFIRPLARCLTRSGYSSVYSTCGITHCVLDFCPENFCYCVVTHIRSAATGLLHKVSVAGMERIVYIDAGGHFFSLKCVNHLNDKMEFVLVYTLLLR